MFVQAANRSPFFLSCEEKKSTIYIFFSCFCIVVSNIIRIFAVQTKVTNPNTNDMEIKVTNLSNLWEQTMSAEEAGAILASRFIHSDNGRQTGKRIILRHAAFGHSLTIKNTTGAFKFEAAN